MAAVKRCFQLPVQSVSGQELVMIVNVRLRARRHPSKAPAANHEVILWVPRQNILENGG